MHKPIIVVMGVSGSGKSTVAKLLARRMGVEFLEGDSLHPSGNVAKMAAGVPLTDADRDGWLRAIAAHIRSAREAGAGLVVACSALKHPYRDILREGAPDLRLVFLQGDFATLAARMAARPHHYMPGSLLESQFETLQPPDSAEHAMVYDVTRAPADIVDSILASLKAP